MQNKQEKKIKRVGVLRGGAGKHYESSLKKGGEIISFIFENLGDEYKTIDILIDKDYIWHINGIPINPGDLVHKVDVVWNTTHPSFSNILDSLSIPNVGVGSFYYALQNSPELLRKHTKSIGLKMPRHVATPKNAREVFEKFGSPWVVKSPAENSGVSLQMAKTFPELVALLEDSEKNGQSIIVEEFIPGKIVSVHSVPMFRDEEIYTFPIGNFSSEEKEKLSNFAKDLHTHIGAEHYLKSDFILTPRGKIYLLQVESMPDLKPDSHFSEACVSVGAQMYDVVEHILDQAFSTT